MDLSVVIVNFNTKKLTSECINSILENTKNLDYEIIIVDNGSSDGSVETFKKLKFETQNRKLKINEIRPFRLKIIENKKNLGFGKGNNKGMKQALGKYILLLNSDTLVNNNLFSRLVTWMDKNPRVGIVSCALKNIDGTLQGNGGFFPSLFRVFAWMFFLEDIPVLDKMIKPFHPVHSQSPFYKGTKELEKEKEMDWVTGAFFLIRKKILAKVGYFDEDYFMYTEEVDLCFRVKKAGWKVWYLPKWNITHLGGASSTTEFPILSEYNGIKLFYKKHLPGWQYPILRLFLKGGALLRILLLGALKGRGVIKTYAKAFSIA